MGTKTYYHLGNWRKSGVVKIELEEGYPKEIDNWVATHPSFLVNDDRKVINKIDLFDNYEEAEVEYTRRINIEMEKLKNKLDKLGEVKQKLHLKSNELPIVLD